MYGCGWSVECMGVAGRWNVWVWIVFVVSRRRVWLVGVGEIYG